MSSQPYKLKSGGRIQGVTTIINQNCGWNKENLKYWAWEQGCQGLDYRATTKKAATTGTIAHYLIECDLRKKKSDLAQYDKALVTTAKGAFKNFKHWKSSVHFEAVEMEPHLISEDWEFGGTPDCIARIQGKLSLFDWKTSKGTYPDMLMQLAAYRILWDENHPDALLQGGFYLLRIGKDDASFHWHYWEKLDEAWEAFRYFLEVSKLKKVLEKRL